MKKRHHVSHSLKQFCKMIQEGQVVFDYPLQRDNNQWSYEQKSLLIHSIATDYAVPAVYSVGITAETESGYTQTIYSILDGKQRLTSVYNYLQDGFRLEDSTPSVRIGTRHYDIAGMLFSELPPTVQEMIYDYQLTMYHFINTTDQELADMFFRLNNGTAMSSQQRVKAQMGLNTARTMNDLKTHPFMTDCLSMPSHIRQKAGDEQVLVQAMMLLDPEHDLRSLSTKEIAIYAPTMKEGKEALFVALERVLDYLVESYITGDHILYKKKHAPFLIWMANRALADGMTPTVFHAWMQSAALTVSNSEYFENVDGKTSARKVSIACNALLNHYEQYNSKLVEVV